ncbi:EI24 domain-containing protein [Solwaraspora sp. WMMD406]|uniref:EI24 domain-containing protein n=1 Tax=Solwaraspora sp. WMMD406 TaxID=3016095 RepID=UPI002415B765|nr:EI24 domain-containing protein [Solwaraspora sp. WMMD406]MDG4768215.1 EI24 domain-containing protein [Solwaraspora sp. WMMD406]
MEEQGGVFRSFVDGVRLFLRGFVTYARNPRMVLLGLIPAVISGALFVAAFIGWVNVVVDVAGWLTPFADGWSAGPQEAVRGAVAIALLALGGLLGVLTFTAVTLFVGDPFYEKISEWVEERHGGVPNAVDVPWWRSLWHSLLDSSRLIAFGVLIGIPLFIFGFVPIVGQIVVPVLAALFGGWRLALELVGSAFYRRGLRLPDRRAALRTNRPRAIGFGVAVFCCCLIPLGAVLIMPAAVAGATLLARQSLGQPTGGPLPGGQPTGGQPTGGQPTGGQSSVG